MKPPDFKNPNAAVLNLPILLAPCANFSGSFCMASSTASTQLIADPPLLNFPTTLHIGPFAAASFLIQIPGILIFGGLLLAFVCWRFFQEIRHAGTKTDTGMKTDLSGKLTEKQQFSQALLTIAVADISMSLDNVVAVAAIAREDTALLVFGLVLAIVLMAFFATFIMRIMTRFPWLSWVGLIFLVYLTIKMLVDGWLELLHIL